jgi:autotransporter passenger strand-loop-strand repeat protein
VLSGGLEEITSGGVTHATTVLSGGLADIYAGGVASGDIVSSGGFEFVSSGGVTHATTVLSGGLEYVYSGGVASGTILSSGGEAFISAGGGAVSATLLSGGIDEVLASGAATGTVVSFGGDEFVMSGGVASGTTALSGGLQHVFSSGLSVDTTISNRAREVVYFGGTASGLTVLSGGDVVDDGQVLFSGAGTLAGAISGTGYIVERGGGDLLISGNGADYFGAVVVSGGTIELATSGAIGAAGVTFAEPLTGSAVLQIDAADAPAAGGTFANPLVNFSTLNEDVDLRSIAFVAGATAAVVGATLVLTDGGNTYTFDIDGSVANAYPVFSDGHGGTLIDPVAIAPKAIDPKVLAFAHTAAAFAPSDAAKTALVSSTSPTDHMPFLRATASATAGHL